MLRRILAIIVVCWSLIPALVVNADLVVTPNNDFYVQHKDKIIYLGRSFTANGKDGTAAVKKEPGSKFDKEKLQNGTKAYIQYSCLYDGEFWGFTFDYSGWIKLDQMLVLYDYIAFAEDHPDEFYAYNGDYAEIKETHAAIAWPWPGADAPLWTFEDLDTDGFRASYAFKDVEGREWGFVSHLYGNRNIWICLSDPLNRDLPILCPAPEPSVWVSETEHVDIKQYTAENDFTKMLIVVLVLSVVIGTAVLIKHSWKQIKLK